VPTPCLRPIALIAAAMVVATGTVACSSGTTSRDQTGTSTTSSAPTGHGAFAHCLSEHGAPSAPGPAIGPSPGVDADTWNRAMQTCASLAPGPPA
jgi:hypothetical protein